MIKFVISPEYFGSNDSKNKIKKQLNDLGAHNVEIDEATGFVSAVMNFNCYEEFLLGLKRKIEEKAKELTKGAVKEIKFNPDYTVFKIYGNRIKEVEKKNIAIELFLTSSTYQVLSGVPQPEVSMCFEFYNSEGKLLKKIDSEELINV